jgi:predicted ribosome quality control (RQC) complex YloA/Tae2 family protein
MPLRPHEVAEVITELTRDLSGAVVQKVFCPSSKRCYLELRVPGRSTLLCVCTEPSFARLSVADKRQAAEGEGSGFQRRLRTDLVGLKLSEVRQAGLREVVLRFEGPGGTRTLFAELGGRGDLVLMDEEGRALAASEPRFLVPRAPSPDRAPEPTIAASRLTPLDEGPLARARAAEALFDEAERADRERRALQAQLAPLKARLTRLERTLEKVRQEASRGPAAEEHRSVGELLNQNLFLLKRGQKEAVLTRYTEAGPVEVRVRLDPRRSPHEEAEWHFHQYRRLTRGTAQAQRRLGELEAERLSLASRIEALKVTPLAPGVPPPQSARQKAVRTEARPHREYRSRDGHAIWVGKGGADNDSLTFKHAAPNDLWLHARGLPGAHVVVPLKKGEQAPQEVLLDAAHLALHHSEGKGEPRGEVSYTSVKYVRKAKGGAPGQVTYTREKTFLLRIEPERLARLLAQL